MTSVSAMSRRGNLMVVAAAASWGTWSLFLRPVAQPAVVTGPLIFLMIGLVCLPWAVRQPSVQWTPKLIVLLCANGLFDALNVVTFFEAMQRTTVAVAVLTHYLAPCLIALAALWITRTPNPRALLAAIVALIGLVLVLSPWQQQPGHPTLGVGALLGFASAICYAANVFVVGRVAAAIGSLRAMSYHALIAGVVLLPFGASHMMDLTAQDIGIISAAAVSIGALSGVLFVVGLSIIGPARAAVLTYAEPLVAVLVGAIFWHEPLGLLAIVGGIVIAAAGIFTALSSNSEPASR
jgi:drug/metabolite transporter, DME family